MKNITKSLAAALLAVLTLTGCGDKAADSSKAKLKVGATPIPHEQLLNLVKSDLAEQNIVLEVVPYTDYVLPNEALSKGDLDANFMQHKPYMDTINADRGLKLVSVAGIHVEPMGLYSKKLKSLDDLQVGEQILIPNDPTNGGRALILLHNAGVLKLADPTKLSSTEKDIADNPKSLKITAMEAAMLPRMLDDPKVAGAVINGNYALQASLSANDAILREGAESPYVNIIAVRAGSENDARILALIKALKSEKVAAFIKETYKGEVVPAF